ncbi:hypothetical protein ACFV06_00690 [Streptomyces sp. NPDC059618]|uniref:hypothetical protein n=1 Tax=Streptomyces sp. NPDC059618 TaxID=3346887 RepID=UPI0036A71BEC
MGAVFGGLLATFFGLRVTLLIGAVGGALSLLWLLPSPIPRIHSLAADKPVAPDSATDARALPC